MIVLIVGSTGAGKTTYSRALAGELPGVVYSIDNWMKSLFGPDMPAEPDTDWFRTNHAWYMERIGRCEKLIFENALVRAKLSQKSILDLGFTTAEHRRRFIKMFSDTGIAVETHFLNVDAATRWSRVQGRNAEKGATYVMPVDRPMFDFMENMFEPPTEAEGATVRIVGGAR